MWCVLSIEQTIIDDLVVILNLVFSLSCSLTRSRCSWQCSWVKWKHLCIRSFFFKALPFVRSAHNMTTHLRRFGEVINHSPACPAHPFSNTHTHPPTYLTHPLDPCTDLLTDPCRHSSSHPYLTNQTSIPVPTLMYTWSHIPITQNLPHYCIFQFKWPAAHCIGLAAALCDRLRIILSLSVLIPLLIFFIIKVPHISDK